MRCRVLFHDNCFDGAASAAVFSRFYRERIHPEAELEYRGLAHKAGGSPIDESVFGPDENAIVDFRYSQSPKLTWWFDHHASAFQQPGDEAHFRADTSGRKFHDPTRKSCTLYLSDIAGERFGFNPKPLAELLHWAELIDGAMFESPAMAVELKEPALQIMTVLESTRDAGTIESVIRDMQTRPLSEIAQRPNVAHPFRELYARHQRNIEVIRRKARFEDSIVWFDVADENLDSLNKFISYYLYPQARYTVWVGRSAQRAKVSIGSNPWRPEERRHDLSKIAERYGGGGHPVVAAISFASADFEKARSTAAEILAELKR
ncbi:MAG TPA: hypothetical protein VE549_12125 [Myxococcaceae bacterium]|nr:hypothetical protein [Myxococcaceae bacterium]